MGRLCKNKYIRRGLEFFTFQQNLEMTLQNVKYKITSYNYRLEFVKFAVSVKLNDLSDENKDTLFCLEKYFQKYIDSNARLMILSDDDDLNDDFKICLDSYTSEKELYKFYSGNLHFKVDHIFLGNGSIVLKMLSFT